MAAESVIRPFIGGLVEMDVAEDDYFGVYRPSMQAQETALAILEAAYMAHAIEAIDKVMTRHRDLFATWRPEFELLDQVWKDLRTACGLPADFENDPEDRQ